MKTLRIPSDGFGSAIACPRALASTACLLLATACASGDIDRQDAETAMQQNGAPTTGMASNTDTTSSAETASSSGGAGAQTAAAGAAAGQAGMDMQAAATVAPQEFGVPEMGGMGQSSDRWAKADVTRNGQNYFFMANGWGPGFESQDISWDGTSFTIDSMAGKQGDNWEPASYPTVFCGVYSDSASKECGLPAAIDSITTLKTGWRWNANGNAGQYNAAYDIWMANGSDRNSFAGFLMVWLRDPPGQQPAGSPKLRGVTVENVPGQWDIWTGTVNNSPIINWVRAEGSDSAELEFDVMDFIRDAKMRGLEVPGTHVLSVAVGFEIWNGPIQNLATEDFYVGVQ